MKVPLKVTFIDVEPIVKQLFFDLGVEPTDEKLSIFANYQIEIGLKMRDEVIKRINDELADPREDVTDEIIGSN